MCFFLLKSDEVATAAQSIKRMRTNTGAHLYKHLHLHQSRTIKRILRLPIPHWPGANQRLRRGPEEDQSKWGQEIRPVFLWPAFKKKNMTIINIKYLILSACCAAASYQFHANCILSCRADGADLVCKQSSFVSLLSPFLVGTDFGVKCFAVFCC